MAGKQAAIQDFLDHLSISYLIALAAIFFLLTVLFGGYGQPLLVMAAIPFGMVGAFMGHFLLGYSLTLWSLVGVIAVSGVVVNDNLVLIDAVNSFRAHGMRLRAAVIGLEQGCRGVSFDKSVVQFVEEAHLRRAHNRLARSTQLDGCHEIPEG